MNQELLQQLCVMRGIESEYVDAWGNPARVDEESKKLLLAALGYAVEDEASLRKQFENDIANNWKTVLGKVVIIRGGQGFDLALTLRKDALNLPVSYEIKLESGESITGVFTPLDGQLQETANVDGVEYQKAVVALQVQLPLGYHRIILKDSNDQQLANSRLICAPQACYKPDSIQAGKKVWGPSVQMYCLRSTRNWGVGDMTDLKSVVANIARGGGDFVGLNPIHALYPNNPESASPYSPSSRRWLNIIYIDVEAVPEYQDSAEAKALVSSNEFQARLQALREKEWVDYTGATEAKLEALRLVYKQFQQVLKAGGERADQFKAFVEKGGESLLEQALYDALQEHFYAEGLDAWGWPSWPQEFNEYHKPAVKKWYKANPEKVEFYAYLQWLVDQQLAEVDALAKELGMELGLYRDLAVGVSEGSTEIWANSDLYTKNTSVGAPPDILGPLGQNWGLPPMNPAKLIEQEYQPMIDLFRSNMRSCGALRIDHVMALLRLWLVPTGKSADKGAYLYYDVDALLALLALESYRNKCLVIGEDLGTVPDGIGEKLQSNGVHSYRVFFFEQADDGGFISPAHYPEQAMATLTTHDMPTLIGFWHCEDLRLGRELGLYPDDQVLQSLYNDRHESKQKILDSLHGHRSIPDYISRDVNWVGMNRDLNFGMQYHMAAGHSALLSLQLEDWLEMDRPVNVPGTSTEYPNWRRKLSQNLEDLWAKPEINHLMIGLTEARERASGQ